MREVELRCRFVSTGFGFGGCGEMWLRESTERGPDERRRE